MENTLTITAFVLGMTQVVKDLGWLSGQPLKLLAIVLGGFATFVTLYYPEVWEQLTAVLIAVGVTGGVSFVDERLDR